MSDSMQRFDEHTDRLYSLPLSEFTAARDDLVKELRGAGDREQADRIKALGKPTVSAWVVNQLYRSERTEYDELLAAGDELRQAVAKDPAALRAATDRRRKALANLLRAAEPILGEAGHRMSAATKQRVTRTLEALSAGGGGQRPGCLTGDLGPSGFDALFGLAPAPAADRGAKRAKKPDSRSGGRSVGGKKDATAGGKKAAAARRAAEKKIAEARAALDRAEEERSKAARELAAATKAKESTEETVGEAREEAAAAEKAARKAKARAKALATELTAARASLQEAKRLERRTSKAVETARRKLDRLERS